MSDAIPADFDAEALDASFDSPYPVYADLRARCPVAHTDSFGGFWALMAFQDVFNAAADFRAFTTTVQNVVPKVAFTGRRPPLHLDPPEHTPYRRVLNDLLTQERADLLEPFTRAYARELVAPMVAAGRADICEAYSSRLPIAVFAEWMNLPPDMVESLRTSAKAFNIAVQSAMDDVVKVTSLELYELARTLIGMRKEAPLEGDFVSSLLAARSQGEALPDELIIGCVRQVLVVGIIAPTVMIGSIAVHLARHPDLQAQLRADPTLMPAALEEFLRLYTPYRGFARTAVKDIQMGGRTIKAGDPVALTYASANRDDAVFPDADQFILNRPNIRDHIAFGVGPHRCAGVNLARMELRVMIEELLAATPGGFELAGEIRPTRMPEIGALSVPLRFL